MADSAGDHRLISLKVWLAGLAFIGVGGIVFVVLTIQRDQAQMAWVGGLVIIIAAMLAILGARGHRPRR